MEEVTVLMHINYLIHLSALQTGRIDEGCQPHAAALPSYDAPSMPVPLQLHSFAEGAQGGCGVRWLCKECGRMKLVPLPCAHNVLHSSSPWTYSVRTLIEFDPIVLLGLILFGLI